MTVLVLGPNGSGKSVYAEKLAASLSVGELYYIATMIPYGDEGSARVERHRKQRESMGFVTFEEPVCLSGIRLSQKAVVLLEDVSNLLGNALFGSGGGVDVFKDITDMCGKCRASILVSIGGLAVTGEYDAGTQGYIEEQNRLNNMLFDYADAVVEMHGGRPDIVKKGIETDMGSIYALD